MDFLLGLDSVIWLISLARPENLKDLVKYVGVGWVYATLFGIVFAETGLVIGFFLPGDSLLFTAGFLAGSNPPVFDFLTLNIGLIIAAVVGDAVNYSIGAINWLARFRKRPVAICEARTSPASQSLL